MPLFVDCVDRTAFSKYSTVNGPHPGLTGLRVAVGGVQRNGGLLQRCRVKDRLLVAEIQGAGLEGQEELEPKSLRWWSGWTRILRIAATPGPLRWSAPMPTMLQSNSSTRDSPGGVEVVPLRAIHT